MKRRPAIDLFWNPKTNVFAVSRYTVDPNTKFTVACGKLLRLNSQKFEMQGLQLVLQCLKEFDSEIDYGKSELETLSAVQGQRFRREHRLIGIKLEEENRLALDPMIPERGGWISAREE